MLHALRLVVLLWCIAQSGRGRRLTTPTREVNVESGAKETQQMLRSSFESIIALHYSATDKNGNCELALEAFLGLQKAANRAHLEQQRSSSRISKSLGRSIFDDPLGVARRKQQAYDFVSEALEGITWDPKRMFMFLAALRKHRRIYERGIDSTAKKLTEVSPSFREAVREDHYLTAIMGPQRSIEGAADLVSYELASILRMACLHAAWHLSYLRWGKTEASKRLDGWNAHVKILSRVSELPHAVIDSLLRAAWEAGQHTAFIRARVIQMQGDDASPHKEAFFKIFEDLACTGALTDRLHSDLQWMIWNLAWYVANTARGFRDDARAAVVRAERHLQRAVRGDMQWRGVNLGGWFLLEKGQSRHFWDSLPESAQGTTCEWDCCEALGPGKARQVLKDHRSGCFCRRDFEEMRRAGLSHVRLPFGAWCAVKPTPGEPYVGPCLEDLDRAIDMVDAAGLMVVLDLHCGRCDPSVVMVALRTVAARYGEKACVCGISLSMGAITNELAPDVASLYGEAVKTVREAGMRAGEVAVILPKEMIDMWVAFYPKYEDVVFDISFNETDPKLSTWRYLTQDMQFAADRARDVLQGMPMCCVGKWSLELPEGSHDKLGVPELRSISAKPRLAAYETATHGWFFSSWRGSDGFAQNMRECIEKGALEVPRGGRDTNLIEP